MWWDIVFDNKFPINITILNILLLPDDMYLITVVPTWLYRTTEHLQA